MRQFISYIVVILVAICGFIGCARHNIIPDDELALIFRDAFLTNAYITNKNINLDSLNIYEPIFDKHGYTTADFHYTIGNFSKRKSARLSDVVEVAIDILEAEGLYYEKEVAILDTINSVAQRSFTRIIYSDTLIRASRLRDTSKLKFVIGNIQPGEYKIEYKYKIDSVAKKATVQSRVWMERADSSKFGIYNKILRHNYDDKFSRNIVADTTIRNLVINMVAYNKKPHDPYITIEDFEIKYIPKVSIAIDSLYQSGVNIKIFADEFLSLSPKDSL